MITNSIEHDSDIQHLPVMAVSEKIFAGYFSTYYKIDFKLDLISKFLINY